MFWIKVGARKPIPHQVDKADMPLFFAKRINRLPGKGVIPLVLKNTVFGGIVIQLLRFELDGSDRIPVSFRFFIYARVVFYDHVIEIFFSETGNHIIFIIYIQKISGCINSKAIESEIYNLVLCSPYILGYAHLDLFEADRVYDFQLRFLSQKKIQAVDTPITLGNVDRSRTQRFIFPPGHDLDLIDLFSIFEKRTQVFVAIIIQGAVSYGGNKSTGIELRYENIDIVLIEIDKRG